MVIMELVFLKTVSWNDLIKYARLSAKSFIEDQGHCTKGTKQKHPYIIKRYALSYFFVFIKVQSTKNGV